jgi:putative NADH-flavin reductase
LFTTLESDRLFSFGKDKIKRKMSQTTIAVFGCGAPSKFSPSILGAGVGGHCIRIAAGEKNFNVKGVARNPAKYQDVYKDLSNVTLVQGDVTKPETLGECLKDCSCAIFAVQASDDATAFSVDRDGLINLAKECVKTNVKLIVISSVYVSPRHYFNPLRGFLNTIVKWRMMDAKWQGEEAIRKIEGLKYTIIRPGSLTDGQPLKNEYKIGQGDALTFAIHPIPKVDAARIAVAACTDPASDKVTFECAGSTSKNPATVEGIFAGLKKD